jgi:molecular chaperone GrpE
MVSRRKKAKPAEEAPAAPRDENGEPMPVHDSLGHAPAAAAGETGLDDLVSTPDKMIKSLTTALQELEDRHLRLAAEYDNFRKRTVKERTQQEARAQADLVKKLLEPLDDLSRVSDLGSNDHDAAAILEGIRLVEAKLRRVLEQMGLRPIDAIGEPFNPEMHEAMITVATDHPDENEIVSQELTKGYLYRETLLRPALVEVKMFRPESTSSDADSGERENGS